MAVTKKCKKYEKHEKYRNLLSNLMKKSKEKYCIHFFQKILKNARKIWEGTNSIISNSATDLFVPQSIYSNGTLTSNSKDIANAFNDYFCN